MARDELDTSESHDTFNIPRWHEEAALWLDFCEAYWRHLRREREVMRLGPPPGYRGGDEVPYQMGDDRHGRQPPAVVRAAAGLRRSLTLAVEQLLPETGVVAVGGADEVERAMLRSPGWEDAVEIALADVCRVKALIASVRPESGLTADCDIHEVIAFLRDETERQVRGFEILTRPRLARLSTQPLAKAGYTLLPADRINKAVIEALAPGAMKELPAGYLDIFGHGEKFWRAYAFGTERRPTGYDQLRGVIGLREEPDESVWRLLRGSSALAVKIHLALWGRAYVEAAGAGTYKTKQQPLPTDYVNTTLARLCDDVGLIRRKGAHKRESREAVAGLLKLLTSLELICVYKPPRNVPPDFMRGAVWRRGVLPEEAGRYHDLFAPRARKSTTAVPRAFSYAPGYYFQHSVWREHNKYVAQVHEGLLGMSCRNDYRWAVTLGAYLSVLARMNGYRKVTLSRRTLVEGTGLRAVYGGKHSSRMRDILEDSLNRLIDLGLLGRWLVKEGTEEPMTDSWRWSESWLATKLEFEWPEVIQHRARQLHRRRQAKRSPNRWERSSDIEPVQN